MSYGERQSGVDGLNAVGHAQKTAVRQEKSYLRELVREEVDSAGKLLATGDDLHYRQVGEALLESIVPALEAFAEQDIESFDDVLHDAERWRWASLSALRERPDRIIGAAQAGDPQAQQRVREALESVTEAAAHAGAVQDRFRSEAPAMGFSTQLGIHKQKRQTDFGSEVSLVTEQSGNLKTLYTGKTGQGKSATMETEAEDMYMRQFDDDWLNVKLIEPLGFRDGENWFYDIPQQDDELANMRRRMGLPPTFEDYDGPAAERDIQILLPLTPGLTEQNLPFDTDDERFSVEPFAVPASTIKKELLVMVVSSRLTDEKTNVIRDAYNQVDNRRDDWALADLAEEIRSRQELSDAKKKPPLRTLKHLQQRGFIRTKDSEHTLNWRKIFQSTETVTVFSQAFMDDELSKLICFGHLVETMVSKRQQMYDVPQLAILMRELWKVVPHSKRNSFDARASELQKAIGRTMSELFRENRHSGVHVLGDTQVPGDLLLAVREMFARFVVFDTSKKAVEKVFSWAGRDDDRQFYRTINGETGVASVVGQVGEAIKQDWVEYIGPVDYAPPPFHHRLAQVDTTGWHARCKYLDSEELRRPADVDGVEWPDEVPTRLTIDAGYDEDSAPEPETQPVAAFADRCLRISEGEAVKKDIVATAFNAFAHDFDRDAWDFDDNGVRQRFSKRLKEALDLDKIRTTTRDHEKAYNDLTLTSIGQEYYNDVMEGYEDAAAPLTDR